VAEVCKYLANSLGFFMRKALMAEVERDHVGVGLQARVEVVGGIAIHA